jgi:autotransporter strand-loop-strand O-heptosyltransferase
MNKTPEPQDIPSSQMVQPLPAQSSVHQEESVKDSFLINPPDIPTQEGPLGIRYDFNDGARVLLPKGEWHVQIEDAESDNILFSCDANEGWVASTKKYFVLFAIKVWKRGEKEPVLNHTLDLQGKEVQIKFPVGTVGDIVGWLPYAERFQLKHKCFAEFTMAKEMVDLYSKQYPQIIFTPIPLEKPRLKKPYASYKMGLFFRGDNNYQPIDFRKVGLHRTAGYILGVDPREEPPRVNFNNPRTIKEPYVCIATKASSQSKMWNNGWGWKVVVEYLKSLGYRVLCIDRDDITGLYYVWNQLPREAEDFTGNKSLSERIALLQHCDFFIGLSSGLSWLAWCAKVPIVMISGFSLPVCEFYTPYRVFNSHGCNGCWDDVNENFDHKDFFWCPKHKGTERQFECTRLITPKQVIRHIKILMSDYNLIAPNKRTETK